VRQGLLLLPIWFTLAAACILCLAGWLSGKFRKARSGPLNPSLPFSAQPGKVLILFLALTAIVLLAVELRGSVSERNYRAGGPRLTGETFPNPDALITLEAIPANPVKR